MGEQWTAQRVLSLAPDASSAKSGQGLSSARHWQNLGRNETTLWGECQGSGSKPYQTQIDLTEPAFKCSCPSRKFPCKHSLGLFLMLAQSPSALGPGDPPAWVAQWLASRAQRAEKKAQQQDQPEKTVDPAAQARRLADREKKIAAGLEQLDTWLSDITTRGLAAIQSEGYAPWEQMAARMLDAQAPGLARLLREAADAASSGTLWQQRLLLRLSRIHLLLQGYKRLGSLSEPLQAEIRSLVGWTQSTDELLAQPAVQDTWQVVGQQVSVEERLRVQRTWIWGAKSCRAGMLLQFAHGALPFSETILPGTQLDAAVVFYPGAYPLRAMIKDRNGATGTLSQISGYSTILDAISAYAGALALSPWIEVFPMPLEAVSVHRDGESWRVRDTAGDSLPVSPRFARAWQMLSQSGGHAIGVFGQWDGESLLPLGLTADGQFAMLLKE